MIPIIITTCGNSETIARSLARKIKAKYSPLTIANFPDGDIYLKFATDVRKQTVVIVNSFQPHPNKALYDIVFAAETAKDLGAKQVILIAPYLAFMRQDKRFNPGECISSRVMAKLLNGSIDRLLTIDPHLHRYKSLKDIFTTPAKKLTANELIAKYIKQKLKDVVIMGPDWESYQWAESIAKQINVPVTVLEKTRYSSHHVAVKVKKEIPIKGKNVVILDDIISTGHTIAEAAKQARQRGARSITAIGVHGLFVENAISRLKKAGVSNVVTTNCIEHQTNKIDVTALFVQELKKRR